MTSSGSGAEEHHREAIEHLRNCRMATHLARIHLVYGGGCAARAASLQLP